MQQIPQNLLDAMKDADGSKILGLPFMVNPEVVYFNKSALDAVQIPYPEGDWTWDEFFNIAEKLSLTSTPAVLDLHLNVYEPIIKSLGGSYSSADRLKVKDWLNKSETVHAFTQLRETAILNRAMRFPNKELIEGKIGMTIGPAFNFRDQHFSMLQIQNDDIGISPLPTDSAGKSYVTAQMSGLAINSRSKNQELAWELIRFLALDNENPIDLWLTHAKQTTLTVGKNGNIPSVNEETWQMLKESVKHAQPSTFQVYKLDSSHGGGGGYSYPDLGLIFDRKTDLNDALMKLADNLESVKENVYLREHPGQVNIGGL